MTSWSHHPWLYKGTNITKGTSRKIPVFFNVTPSSFQALSHQRDIFHPLHIYLPYCTNSIVSCRKTFVCHKEYLKCACNQLSVCKMHTLLQLCTYARLQIFHLSTAVSTKKDIAKRSDIEPMLAPQLKKMRGILGLPNSNCRLKLQIEILRDPEWCRTHRIEFTCTTSSKLSPTASRYILHLDTHRTYSVFQAQSISFSGKDPLACEEKWPTHSEHASAAKFLIDIQQTIFSRIAGICCTRRLTWYNN